MITKSTRTDHNDSVGAVRRALGLLVGLAVVAGIMSIGAAATAASDGGAAGGYRRPVTGWVNALKPKGRPAGSLTLAVGGRTDYRIVIPAKPTTMEEKAATDLAQWLQAITDAEFRITKEEPGVAPRRVISVGNTSLCQGAGVSKTDLRLDGYGIAARGDTLFVTGGSRRGIINGVYAFLEEDLGCRWYQAGDAGAVIPHRPTLRLQPVTRVYIPTFELLRGVHYSDANDVDWALRNRTFHWQPNTEPQWGGYAQWPANMGVCHTYNRYLPPAEHFDKHPEYYMMTDDGRRSPLQLCPTHPDVVATTIGKIKDLLDKDPNAVFVDVSPNDGGGACHCPTCKALIDKEGTEMAPLLQLVNAVADSVQKSHPRVLVTTLAYLNTVAPPKSFGPRPNVVIWLCTDAHAWSYNDLFITETDKSSRAMQAWHDRWRASSLVWDYPSNWAVAPVNFNLPVIASNLHWYAERGGKGILFQTEHNHNYGFDHSYQRCWIFAKLGWDPTLDTRRLIRDFNYGFYGAAAPHMQAYDDMIWSAWESWHRKNVKKTPWNTDEAAREKRSGFASVDASFWETAERHLTAAEKAVPGDDVLMRRVRTARLPLTFMKLEKGPGDDIPAYEALITEFEADAKAARLQIIHTTLGTDLATKVEYWRKLTVPPPGVPRRELDNVWRFAPDPGNKGMAERWFDPGYSDLAWASIRSDSDAGWDTQGFEGVHLGWYRQTFTVTEDMLKRFTLWMLFGAVDEEATVFINGRLAFEHTVKSTGLSTDVLWNLPFVFDARSFVTAGDNTLAVHVADTVGMAGIWRPVQFILQDTRPDPRKTWDDIQLIRVMQKLKAK